MSAARALMARLRGRTLAELGDRALQAGRAVLERAGLSRDTAEPDAATWRAELGPASARAFADAEGLLGAFRSLSPTRFFAGTQDAGATIAALRIADPGAQDRTLALGEAAARGHFRLLGYDDLDFGTPTDWHLDPVLGRRAPLVHWSRVPFLDARTVGDHKVVWELNRHQWLLHLAKAYRFTQDERWAEQALAAIDAWIDANPRKLGINWASSLEIAFRAIAWLWVIHLLRDAKALSASRFARIVRVLAVSGRHVERHLSTWFSPNTHLTGEALGLLYLGCALPELKDAQRWCRRGLEILARRIPEHVRPDGTYVEQSTHYARYTVDFLVHAVALGRRSGLEVPAGLVDALRRGAWFLRHAARPDGSLPLLGDDDGGRVLFLDPRAADDVRPTLAGAAALIDEPGLAFPDDVSEEPFWLLGPAAASAPPAVAAPQGSKLFPDGGFAILRDGWDARASVAVLDCGPHGMSQGGHAHGDLGSIELTLRGRSLIRDPGTFSYADPVARDEFRAASAHAVPLVDGHGSAQPGSAFAWLRSPQVLARGAHISAECDIVAFSHDGFLHLPDPVAHRRALLRVRRDYWLVIDDFRGIQSHDVLISYPLAPGLRPDLQGRVAVIRGESREAACIQTTGADWLALPASLSGCYGRREPAVRLAHRMAFSGRLATATLVHPGGLALSIGLKATTGEERTFTVQGPGAVLDIVRLAAESGSFEDSSGRRTSFTWPALCGAAAGRSAR